MQLGCVHTYDNSAGKWHLAQLVVVREEKVCAVLLGSVSCLPECNKTLAEVILVNVQELFKNNIIRFSLRIIDCDESCKSTTDSERVLILPPRSKAVRSKQFFNIGDKSTLF